MSRSMTETILSNIEIENSLQLTKINLVINSCFELYFAWMILLKERSNVLNEENSKAF